jgi:hypothetical protein
MTYAPDVVHGSIKNTLDQIAEGREGEYKKYSDYYDGTPDCVCKPESSRAGYFVRRHFETEERFKDRPKISIPIAPLIVDTHAEALAGGVTIKIDDEATAETWEAIAEHNQMSAFLRDEVATISGLYGASGVKPLIFDDNTKEKKIEFENYGPDACKFVYEEHSSGRSVKRYQAVGIHTGYSYANTKVMPLHLDYELAKKFDFRNRREVITKDTWGVWLDDTNYPISPLGEQWQPAEDGSNPYGEVMVSLFNALGSIEDFLGKSDLHNSIYDIQVINELFSDIYYAHRKPKEVCCRDWQGNGNRAG